MTLISAEVLASKEDAFMASIPLAGYCDPSLSADPITGRCLRFYLLLTYRPELVADPELSAAQLFWSRVYWFTRYVTLQQALRGPDEGLAQQLFQVLESHPAGEPDWTELEQVEAAAARDARAQLAGD